MKRSDILVVYSDIERTHGSQIAHLPLSDTSSYLYFPHLARMDNLIYSHGSWLTPEEDAKVCDMVDALQQGD